MYVCVIVDKLNHCTAFKLKCSPWDNKYTHADIQVRYSDSLRAHRDSLCVPVEEELRFQGLRIRKLWGGTSEEGRPLVTPGGSVAPPAGGSGDAQKQKQKQKNPTLWPQLLNLSNMWSRNWAATGTQPGTTSPFSVFELPPNLINIFN